jgi:hypothetical protein
VLYEDGEWVTGTIVGTITTTSMKVPGGVGSDYLQS